MTQRLNSYKGQVRETINSDEAKELARLILVAVDMFVAYFEKRNLPINVSFSRRTQPSDPSDIVVRFDWTSLQN